MNTQVRHSTSWRHTHTHTRCPSSRLTRLHLTAFTRKGQSLHAKRETCCALWKRDGLCPASVNQPLCACVCPDELLDPHNSSSDLAALMEQINNSYPACSRKFPARPPPAAVSSQPQHVCVSPQRRTVASVAVAVLTSLILCVKVPCSILV